MLSIVGYKLTEVEKYLKVNFVKVMVKLYPLASQPPEVYYKLIFT